MKRHFNYPEEGKELNAEETEMMIEFLNAAAVMLTRHDAKRYMITGRDLGVPELPDIKCGDWELSLRKLP